ncbi:hypothetical protein VNO77_10476 [Canavalia gladiata]|uniref:Uncharacterized protein n=1 Tax=Canavalia gladiata TaxID=3824 RepID=A0AAN9QX50_CANGL
MPTLKRPSNSKDKEIVGRFKPDGRCKKHPKHRQSPGVCSLCLRDKLSQLSSSSRKPTSASSCISSSASSSLSSYYSSNSASSCASPTHPFPFSVFLLNAKHGGLVKSRSMALVPRRREEAEGVVDDHHNKSLKKGGFWSKLLHPKSKRSMEDKTTKLLHTTSLLETMT